MSIKSYMLTRFFIVIDLVTVVVKGSSTLILVSEYVL